jgi:hypothetical protein
MCRVLLLELNEQGRDLESLRQDWIKIALLIVPEAEIVYNYVIVNCPNVIQI